MFSRIVFFSVTAASLAAAAPTLAYDPSGPPPDDPAAAKWVAPANREFRCERGAPPADDPSAVTWVRPKHTRERGAPPADDPSGVTKSERRTAAAGATR